MSNLIDELTEAYKGRTVLLTGHTGFKGSWLSEWLLLLGARVVGIALEPDSEPSLFNELGLADRLEHHILDVRDREVIKRKVQQVAPDYLFHLAAQPLVRHSYVEPVETWDTNVMGTIHLLEALRNINDQYAQTSKFCASVFVTSDKCYENREWVYGYRETDALGGRDPYSSSKAAAELGISAFRRSFFTPNGGVSKPRVGIASARAGNVIGGGDWAVDRIVPDCVRHLERGDAVPVRNPQATRPWQHVLEPLSGYLILAARQFHALESEDMATISARCNAFNFGPEPTSNRSVGDLVEEILRNWPGDWIDESDPCAPHEAGQLNLSWDLAYQQLGWTPRWDFAESIKRTVYWYQRHAMKDAQARELVHADIVSYVDRPLRIRE